MPVRGNTFKIFVGNLAHGVTSQDLRGLFEPHGTVCEADAVKNFGFVHMQNEEEGKAAISALNGHVLHGKPISVEASTGAKKMSHQKTKIFIGNLPKETKLEEIRALFEAYGVVVEADILNNYAFVHMEDEAHAREAINNLDGCEYNGMNLRVQESTSRVRQTAGMGNSNMCYRCGSAGHWSKECPRDGRFMPRFPERGVRLYGARFDPYAPPPPGYGRERPLRYREDYEYSRYAERFYEDEPLYDRPYERAPLPPIHADPYDRRPLVHHASAAPRPDYLRVAPRRTPPPRYPPPPPSSFGGPHADRGFGAAIYDRRHY